MTLLGALILAACDLSGPGSSTLLEIERNRARWDSVGLETYEYSVERICFCGFEARGPVRVEVRGGEATERTYVDSGEPVPETFEDLFPTVDGLFAILFEAVRRDAHSIQVTYDPVTGVPFDFFIDYEHNVADEELGFRVTDPPGPPGSASVPTR